VAIWIGLEKAFPKVIPCPTELLNKSAGEENDYKESFIISVSQ
jgi:hypothetical protein